MKPNEILKIRVFDGTTWHDITSGTLSVNTKYGTDTFNGFWDQPDTGQFSIVSRGSTIDPNINQLIKTNALISIFAEFKQPGTYENYSYYTPPLIYLGFITDVKVEYIKNEKQIVTLNGTDLIGFLNRIVLTQDYIDTNIIPNYPNSVVPVSFLIGSIKDFLPTPPVNDWIFQSAYNVKAEPSSNADAVNLFPSIANSPRVKVEAGMTLYNLISSGSSTGLITYETEDMSELDYFNYNLSLPLAKSFYTFFPYSKYDATFYNPDDLYFARASAFHLDMLRTNLDDPIQDTYFANNFGPYITGGTFKNVRIKNGFDQIINQVSVTNTDPATGTISDTFTATNEQQVAIHGPAKLESYTNFTTTSNPFWLSTSTIEGQAAVYQNDIIQYQSEPVKGISSVIIDYTDNQIENPEIGNELYIQHKIAENNYIYGYYVISGIRHNITRDSWTTELILRDSEYQKYNNNRPKTPVISINKTYNSTTQSYNVQTAESLTASISNYTSQDLADIERIEWMVNIPQGGGIQEDSIKYRVITPPSQDLKATDQEGTWPSNIPIFTGNTVTWTYDDNGVLAPYGEYLYGPMSNGYQIGIWITNKKGYTTAYFSEFVVVVTASQAYANFTFTKDAQDRVTFTDQSGSDTNTWAWNFGDGTTYNGKTPPLKTYAVAGTYTVTLTVNNGYDTDTITKTVIINSYTMDVKYIRLRYQGTVTKAAGETDYSTDLIDTFGNLSITNTSSAETGGNNPVYIVARTLDKVQDLAATTWISTSELTSNYNPVYRTNYASGGPLDPMSQSYGAGDISPSYISSAKNLPKYKFLPVITNNIDGSQTKSIDIDLILRYDQRITVSPMPDFFDGKTSTTLPYRPGGVPSYLRTWAEWGGSTNEKQKISKIELYPGSDLIVNGRQITNTQMTINNYNEAAYYSFSTHLVVLPNVVPLATAQGKYFYKNQYIQLFNSSGVLAAEGTIGIIGTTGLQFTFNSDTINMDAFTGSYTVITPTTMTSAVADRLGIKQGKTYLPISVSVSEDGTTYRKVGDMTFNFAGTVPGYPANGTADKLTTTYLDVMPPMNGLPVES